jgi:hypothetical protein
VSSWEATGQSDEWYTPKYIFDALGCEFDIDVAAPWAGPWHCPARMWLCEEDDAFAYYPFWKGRFAFMNMPFGGRGAIEPWLDMHFDNGNGIALTPDRTSAPWFRKAWAMADLVMFLPKVRFIRPCGSDKGSPGTGTALWAAGDRAVAALRRAAINNLGILASPERLAA